MLVVVAIVVAALAGVTVLRRSYAQVDGDSRLIGLDAAAEVVRDSSGVPHVSASTLHDVFFLQGYVTAQDRLWQLQLLRATGQGRLSEMFGTATLDTDKFVRTVGWYRVARREVGILEPDTRAALDAYADGVNKYADTHRDSPPLEFLILGVNWEPWTAADSVAIGKILSWQLSGNEQSELVRADVVARLGPDAARVLFPDVPASTPAIFSEGWNDVVRSPGEEGLRALLGATDLEGLGSNSWVLSGARTTTGKPLLANDPHLGLDNPSIWYLVHLAGGGLDVAGFSIPGAPGVVVGHNARIAWGFTNLGPDVEDLYIERPNPLDPRQFQFGDRFETATVYRETIEVKGREPAVLEVTETRHGPILTPVLEGTKQLLALRWTALDPGHLIDALYRLDRATDWNDFRAAMRLWDVPSQNAIYADVDGHIGYQMPGKVPVRAKGDGHVPVPGWTGEYEWTGYIPFDSLPSRFDPPEGLIVTANQRVVDDFGYFISDEWDPGFRAQRIQQLLRDRAQWSAADFAAIQLDQRDLTADRYLSFLRALGAKSDAARAAQVALRDWDGVMRADQAAPAIFQSWLRHMLERTFRDKLGDALFTQFIGLGRSAVGALYDLVRTPTDPWFVVLADPIHKGRDELAALALDDATAELTSLMGPDQSTWKWGRLHTVSSAHVLGAVQPLDRLFTIGPRANGGDGFTVDAASYSLKKPYAQTSGPSMRMVVDLADLDAMRAILPTGESGQPLAPHWGDMTDKWLAGEYVVVHFDAATFGRLEGTLRFKPR